jgi:hypothetical protein
MIKEITIRQNHANICEDVDLGTTDEDKLEQRKDELVAAWIAFLDKRIAREFECEVDCDSTTESYSVSIEWTEPLDLENYDHSKWSEQNRLKDLVNYEIQESWGDFWNYGFTPEWDEE